MNLIESFIRSKYADESGCEDYLHIGKNYVAVFDGATSKTSTTIRGMSMGQFIVQRLGEFLEKANSGLLGATLVQAMTDCIVDEIATLETMNGNLQEGPSASVAIYSLRSRTITVLGDIQCMVNGSTLTRAKRIDTLLSEVRAVYTRLLMGQLGEKFQLQDDPGRQVILPVLKLQYLLQNNEFFGDYGYGCINGKPVPLRFVEVYEVQPGDEVILCTDGYPEPAATLHAAEKALHADLESDPLRIFSHASTKGLRGEQFVSFDDRAYVRFVA